MRALTNGLATGADQPWLPGLVHAIAVLAVWPAFGAAACVTGLLIATLASFVVYLPITALTLNGGQPIEAEGAAPALTPPAQIIMLILWTVTAWLAALGYATMSAG